MSSSAKEKGIEDPALIAPTEQIWRAMTEAERRRFLGKVLDTLADSKSRLIKDLEARADDAQAQIEQAQAQIEQAQAESEQALAALRESVLAILSARRIPLSDAARARFLACRDISVLQGWLVRAATASTEQDVIGE